MIELDNDNATEDEYQPGIERSDDSEGEEDFELDADEDDAQLEKKRGQSKKMVGGKKLSAGVAMRQQVQQIRDKKAQEPETPTPRYVIV